MNNIERQILENQLALLQSIGGGRNCVLKEKQTKKLLEESKEEDCCEMPKKFAEQKEEVKKDAN